MAHSGHSNVPKAQKLAGRPSLEDIFNGSHNISKKARNLLILKAHDVHIYTQREIGEYLQLYPGYISRITLRLRKVRKESLRPVALAKC